MTLLQAIQQSRPVVRAVLAWFVMSMAVAVAAPVVQPQNSLLVCSASGMVKLVDSGGDETIAAGSHTLDCVLCLALYAAPPATVDFANLPVLPSGHGIRQALEPVVLRSDATLTARAPPALI